MIKLVGSMTVNGKTYSASDSTGAVSLSLYNIPDNWYGGNVKDFLRTKEGLLLCRDKKNNLINIAYDDSVVDINNLKEESGIESKSRKELIQMAKELGIPGKLATMSTDDLIKEIKECL